jgi:hypothetical protein
MIFCSTFLIVFTVTGGIAWFFLSSARHIGSGQYGIVNDKVVPGPRWLWLAGDFPCYAETEQITTVNRTIIRWRIDPANLLAYHRQAEAQQGHYPETKFQEVLFANPAIELRQFESALGVKIISQERASDTQAAGVVLGRII